MEVYADSAEAAPPAPRVVWGRTLALAGALGVATALVLLAAVPRDPDRDGARVQAALALYAAGDRAGARAACDELVRDLPEEPRAWLVDGLLREDVGDLVGAEAAYRRSFELSPRDPDRRRELSVTFAELRRRRGDPAGALAELGELVAADAAAGAELCGDPVRLLHARALCLIDLGRLDEALNAAAEVAEKPNGAGVARRIEREVRSRRDGPASRGG
jgi:tetratricopeptide (TPR) repeat protein